MRPLLGASLWALLALGSLALGACKTQAFCFDCAAGGGPGAGPSSGEGGEPPIDPSGGTGGSLIDCGDTLTDPKNCGFCGNECSIANAFSVCEGGFCLIDACAPGWLDLDGALANGCEYPCSVSGDGQEICDGLDNDCNGLVDELTDTTSDPFHCGSCTTTCSYSHAASLCVASACMMGDCFVGYHDANQDDADGCEYACDVTNGGVEVCDYVDNDCDKTIDEGFDTSSDPENCGGCGVRCSDLYAHSEGVCTGGACQLGPCLPGYYDVDGIEANGCEYGCSPQAPGAEACDGEDNDCNGLVDDGALPGVGAACGASSTGECALGTQACLASALACVGAVGPSVEHCDGLDNNCTGAADEGCPAPGATDVRLDTGAGSAIGQASTSQLAVASRGDLLFASYLDMRSGNADIRASVSLDGGLAWLALDVAVATGLPVQVEPAVMLGQANAFVAFGQFGNNNRDVYVARAAPPFSSFTSVRADKDATNADAFFVHGVVAKPGAPDRLVVVWESLTGTGANVATDVYVQSSLDGGVTWKPTDKRVNAVAGLAEQPVLATDGAGRAFIAWRDQRAGKSEVYADVYDVNTGNLSGNQALSAGQPSEHVVIAADAGGPNVYVAWTDLRGAKKAIRVSRSATSGASFGADGQVVNIDSTFADANAPALAAAGGTVVAAWEDTRSGLPDVRVNRSTDAGATWMPQTSRVDLGDTPGVSASTRPSIALGGPGLVYVTWEDGRSGQRDIYGNHSFDGGATFQPFDLRLDVGQAGGPSLKGAADSRSPFTLTNAAGSRAVSVWIDYRTAAGITGMNADVYANFFQ